MFAFLLALLIGLGVPQQGTSAADLQRIRAKAEEHRQIVINLNTLATQLHSEADAQKLVDGIASAFPDALPPRWVSASIRTRIAHSEYEAVSDPAQLIPEQRVADVWNEYVRAIGAPGETLVAPAEIHWLRDAHYSTAKVMWGWLPGGSGFLNLPGAYAVGADGKVAAGCRPLEALRVIWDLENVFENVRVARKRMRMGILTSDLLKKQLEHPKPLGAPSALAPMPTQRYETSVDERPARPAEVRYIQEHGKGSFSSLLKRLFNELLPE